MNRNSYSTADSRQSALRKSHGANLRRLRQEAGLTQERVAQELEVTKQSVSRWENGLNEPSALNQQALTILYGVPLEEISRRYDFVSGDLVQERYRRADLDPKRLREARRESGLTQEQAAARVGVTHTAIGHYERGVVTPKAAIILKLATVYGKPVAWFMERFP